MTPIKNSICVLLRKWVYNPNYDFQICMLLEEPVILPLFPVIILLPLSERLMWNNF